MCTKLHETSSFHFLHHGAEGVQQLSPVSSCTCKMERLTPSVPVKLYNSAKVIYSLMIDLATQACNLEETWECSDCQR